MLPYQQAINRVERRWRRAAILDRLYDAGPAAVYGGLLHYATGRTKPNGQPWNAVGWSKFAFKEIFGVEPRPIDRVKPKPLPDFLIEQWAADRKRTPPAKRGAA
jgi:hypothetical protein